MFGIENNGPTISKMILGYTVLLIISISGCYAFKCHSCSYQRSGDPTRDYECVNAVENATQGGELECAAPKYCITKTVYNTEKLVTSLDRNCREPENLNCGEECCDVSLYTTTCQDMCSTDLCNNADKTLLGCVGDECKDIGITFVSNAASLALVIMAGYCIT
ncbi:hypothetical protein ScPMuIL_012964 [Solemya velum]